MTNQTITGTTFSLTGEQVKQIQTAIKGLKHSKKERQAEVIQNVRFTVANHETAFEALDQNNHVLLTFPNQNEIEGSFILNKSVIKDLKLNKNDSVTFETVEGKVKISINGLTTLQPMEFEFAEPVNYENGLTFSVNSNYVKSLSNALKFVSQSETRPILQGICHEDCGIVCTDSHQLFKNEFLHTLKDGKMTVHSSTAKLVADLMKNKSDNILMSVSSNEKFVRYEAMNIIITGRIIDGNYPVTKNMFPQNFKTKLKLNEKEVKQLSQTIKSMLPFAKRNNLIKFEISNNTLTVKSIDIQESKVDGKTTFVNVETSATVFENVSIKGENMEIAFNGKNVLTALEQQKGEVLTFQFTGKVSPFMIVGDKIKDHYLYSSVRVY